MAADRPAKETVRRLWMECLKERDESWDGNQPLYLTLPGADGKDLLLASEEGIISRTETGGLDSASVPKVVAVEASDPAAARLLHVLPGLKILKQPIQSLIRGEAMTTWPNGEDVTWCRAVVVNLDLNKPFAGAVSGAGVAYPIISWIRKFAVLHSEPPAVPWTLLLTLHGESKLDVGARTDTRDALRTNAARVESFRERLVSVLGVDVESLDPSAENFDLDRDAMQRLLLAVIPKEIAKNQLPGWMVLVRWGYSYGGSDSEAPMVTFRLDFEPTGSAHPTPSAAYEASVDGILNKVGHIAQEGHLPEPNHG